MPSCSAWSFVTPSVVERGVAVGRCSTACEQTMSASIAFGAVGVFSSTVAAVPSILFAQLYAWAFQSVPHCLQDEASKLCRLQQRGC